MYQKYIKRLIDFIVALIALPFFCVLFIFVAPAIIIDDGFPIFYNAKRIGLGGKLFKMYKFRSMKNNSPDIRTESGDTFNSENDPRVTKVGKLLRRTSIDEMPQLLNVLIGNMSLIGPRPDPPDWLEQYTDEERELLKVKPGITGYSQAYFRNSVEAREKIANDVYYAKHCTFLMDTKVFIRTILVVLKHDNVYRN